MWDVLSVFKECGERMYGVGYIYRRFVFNQCDVGV